MNCPNCGEAEHLPIVEDEAHCDCDNGWRGVGRCQCPCHYENCDGFSPTCQGPRSELPCPCTRSGVHPWNDDGTCDACSAVAEG